MTDSELEQQIVTSPVSSAGQSDRGSIVDESELARTGSRTIMHNKFAERLEVFYNDVINEGKVLNVSFGF